MNLNTKILKLLILSLREVFVRKLVYFHTRVMVNLVQTQAVKSGIYAIATMVPAALYIVVGLALAFVYTLDKKKVLENAEILKARREG